MFFFLINTFYLFPYLFKWLNLLLFVCYYKPNKPWTLFHIFKEHWKWQWLKYWLKNTLSHWKEIINKCVYPEYIRLEKNACLIKCWGEIVNAIKYYFQQKPLWYQKTCLFYFETFGTPRLQMCRNVFAKKKCGFKKASTQVLSYENVLEKIKQL